MKNTARASNIIRTVLVMNCLISLLLRRTSSQLLFTLNNLIGCFNPLNFLSPRFMTSTSFWFIAEYVCSDNTMSPGRAIVSIRAAVFTASPYMSPCLISISPVCIATLMRSGLCECLL